MAKISSPIGPTIDVVAQTVSRSVISGGGGGGGTTPPGGGSGGGGGENGRGGAIIARPQTSLVDKAQDLRIQTTQQSVGTLGQSFEVINAKVIDLGNNIKVLSTQLNADSQVEQQNLKDQQQSERKLRERGVRLGKESQIEQGIIAAIAKPIANIQRKVTSIFDRVMGALTTLFFGWLTNQGIETLKAFAEGDTKKLEEIKNNVIKNVLFAVGAFTAVNIGFGLLTRTITGLTLRLVGFGAKLTLAPFRMVGSLIGRILGFNKVAAPAAQTARTAGAAASRSGGFLSRLFGGIKGLKPPGGAGGGLITKGLYGLGGIMDLMNGENIDAIFAAGAAFAPGAFKIPFALGYGADAIAEMFGGNLFGKNPNQPQNPPSSQPATPPSNSRSTPAATPAATPVATPAATPAASSPQTPMAPNLTLTPSSPSEPATAPQTTEMGDLNIDLSKAYQIPFSLSATQIQGKPSQTPKVEPLAEQKPNVIIAGGGKDQTQVVPAGQSEALTDVPLIPSNNPDNFYVLYSQVNYNVVI